MAGTTIYMTSQKQKSLQEIHEKIHYIKDAQQVSKLAQTINDVTIWTLVYEKYFMRNGSYASVTVVLTDFGQEQTASIIAAGGGNGIVNLSFGANRNFAKSVVKVLEDCGFTVTESDLDMNAKGLVERFLE